MVLLADCGSTKCDWALLQSKSSVLRFTTSGYNPSVGSKPAFLESLQENISSNVDDIQELIFFGSGVSGDALIQELQAQFESIFPNVENIEIESDLIGISKAIFIKEPIICCILGTGSNALQFDGLDIFQAIPALGYILGDEGSGAYFGKVLLRDYFYKQLPTALSIQFKKEFRLTKNDMVEKVYRSGRGNVYLAGFMPFYLKNISNPYIQQSLKTGFRAFIENQVLPYAPSPKTKIHFLGSVAFHFNTLLKEVLQEYDLTHGSVTHRPIELLVEKWLEKI